MDRDNRGERHPKPRRAGTTYADRFLSQGRPGAREPSSSQRPLYSEQFKGRSDPPSRVPQSGPPDETPRNPSQPKGDLRLRVDTRFAHLSASQRPKLEGAMEKKLRGHFQELSLVLGNLREAHARPSTIYVTSCFAGEGKTTAAIGAAFGLAVFGHQPTVLVDANLLDGQLHDRFGLRKSTGIQGVLNRTVSLEEAVVPTAYENLYVLPAGGGGTAVPDDRFREVVLELSRNFEYVLLDGRAIFVSSDPVSVAPWVDGLLLVVECEKTKWEVVQLAEEKVAEAGGRICGVVLNKRKYYLPRWAYRSVSRR
ncbi:MAG: putative ATPase [Desulfacinum sp.]|nr:putative ATPase [Desulfacinum sp.]